MKRPQFNKYRAGGEPRTRVAARLVRAASALLQRPVRITELWDVGEDIPVAPTVGALPRTEIIARVHGSDGTATQAERRFAALVRVLGLSHTAFAELVGISRPEVVRISGGADLHIRTLRQIVSGLRGAGYAVMASDVVDVGEERGN